MPYNQKVDYSSVKDIFAGNVGIANLEGGILESENELSGYRYADKFSLYQSAAVIDCMRELNIAHVSLCNNHILDYRKPIDYTVDQLTRNGISCFGLKNHDMLRFEYNGRPIFLFTFATCRNGHRLNLFNPNKLIADIKRVRAMAADAEIIIFPHWGVNGFRYPEPADRRLAHSMIDAGADLIVGHHPHIVAPIERYRDKFIIYSVGNFILPQVEYAGKKLQYGDDFADEILVEYEPLRGVVLHHIRYDRDTNSLSVVDRDKCVDTSFFDNISSSEYIRFYYGRIKKSMILCDRVFNSGLGERMCFVRNRARALARRMLLKAGVHNPYKRQR